MEAPTQDEQRFAVLIIRSIDKKTKKTQLSMQTRGEGISLAEAAIILEGWCKKVKSELQRPFTENLVFGGGDEEKNV
ncbi:hypothetical protein HY641_01965 [Candidatus Woesearchaeota archaeon]|nr:hypothetical protein [Candidatus Woesearchaeota archaeon]